MVPVARRQDGHPGQEVRDTAIVIDVNFGIALILTLVGILVYSVAPDATTDIKTLARHGLMGIVAFFLLLLAAETAGGLVLTPVTAFAFFSAGVSPNLLLDTYKNYTAEKARK